jgi:hypothetical protein
MSPDPRVPDKGAAGADPAAMLNPRLRFLSAMEYAAYEEALRVYDATPLPAGASADDTAHKAFATINLQRATRITRSYTPGAEVAAAVQALGAGHVWGVLSEVWCGDSAQVVPYLARIASGGNGITFRVMLRDENPDVMDRYLTAGKRSIPKLIAWDAEGKELFAWGPRPAGAQAVVDEALAAGLPKEERLERLHLWYGRDRGKGIETELAAVLRSIP